MPMLSNSKLFQCSFVCNACDCKSIFKLISTDCAKRDLSEISINFILTKVSNLDKCCLELLYIIAFVTFLDRPFRSRSGGRG